ncbi:hypothetical protein [Segetibacter aerophilus]|uniref:Uncharacterized protein n=1 Tax=Segetibacter aerophilus TaxID=670293 RepID=A0A512BC69_9BACT|nr:hypothetical protein [Segetibacter aerophilus]GEO09495.1 hypothetical protein SAE01_19910 [Segetibacter aerophilus]
MIEAPTYTLEQLQEIIPLLELDELKSITAKVKNEKSSYTTITMSKILVMISARTLELVRRTRY